MTLPPRSVPRASLTAGCGLTQKRVTSTPSRRNCIPTRHPSAGLQNDCKDRKLFLEMADLARLLTLVPENLWSEVLESYWWDRGDEDATRG